MLYCLGQKSYEKKKKKEKKWKNKKPKEEVERTIVWLWALLSCGETY